MITSFNHILPPEVNRRTSKKAKVSFNFCALKA